MKGRIALIRPLKAHLPVFKEFTRISPALLGWSMKGPEECHAKATTHFPQVPLRKVMKIAVVLDGKETNAVCRVLSQVKATSCQDWPGLSEFHESRITHVSRK
jgi:hypothetical protein